MEKAFTLWMHWPLICFGKWIGMMVTFDTDISGLQAIQCINQYLLVNSCINKLLYHFLATQMTETETFFLADTRRLLS